MRQLLIIALSLSFTFLKAIEIDHEDVFDLSDQILSSKGCQHSFIFMIDRLNDTGRYHFIINYFTIFMMKPSSKTIQIQVNFIN